MYFFFSSNRWKNGDTTAEIIKNVMKPNEWFFDSAIDSYMDLIAQEFPRVRAIARFHYPYEMMAEWDSTKRQIQHLNELTIFKDVDIVLIPVVVNYHWTLAVIRPKLHKIQYYNSFLPCLSTKKVPDIFDKLTKYVRFQFQNEMGYQLDMSDWTMEYDKNIPQQTNNYDCGVFICAYAKYIARSMPLENAFTENDMIDFRQKIANEIREGKLLQPPVN